ncbi:MAG: sigma-70 family RNA polymerase sigma factor [Planctomycetes bacterium]|nr:sigma-70 family RNA polymerase sigma factor [Planctomycetota bacterium]
MTHSLRTTTQLLESLRDPSDREVWFEFDGRYRPILIGFAQRMGLGAEESEEVAQQTLAQFVEGYRDGQYDRSKGRLRNWILGIARHRVIDHQRRQGVRRQWRGDSALDAVPDREDIEAIWRAEEERSILARALTELRQTTRLEERTIRAFELLTRAGRSPTEVATECGMSEDEVYLAKHRVTKRLREIVGKLRTLYEDGVGADD